MRPPEEVKRILVNEWLAKAEEDWTAANVLLAEKVLLVATIGFHAQQAAEKYLKAFLVANQVEFPKTHDLEEILDMVGCVKADLAASLRDAKALTKYAVETRYPSGPEIADPQEAAPAVALASMVRQAILTALGR